MCIPLKTLGTLQRRDKEFIWESATARERRKRERGHGKDDAFPRWGDIISWSLSHHPGTLQTPPVLGDSTHLSVCKRQSDQNHDLRRRDTWGRQMWMAECNIRGLRGVRSEVRNTDCMVCWGLSPCDCLSPQAFTCGWFQPTVIVSLPLGNSQPPWLPAWQTVDCIFRVCCSLHNYLPVFLILPPGIDRHTDKDIKPKAILFISHPRWNHYENSFAFFTLTVRIILGGLHNGAYVDNSLFFIK